MKCKNCNNVFPEGAKFCGKCGTEQIHRDETVAREPEQKQKSFKLGTSKEASIRGLMGIGFIILLKFLGALIGSYLIAGLILGALFAIVEFSFHKKS